MRPQRPLNPADPDRLDTWHRYQKGMCRGCQGTCCSLPVEVRISDLIRLGLTDAFEAEGDPKWIARRLMKEGVVGHFNHKQAIFTLSRRANGDCLYLDQRTRLCVVYEQRPETCCNHPQVGPRPGYCAWRPAPGSA